MRALFSLAALAALAFAAQARAGGCPTRERAPALALRQALEFKAQQFHAAPLVTSYVQAPAIVYPPVAAFTVQPVVVQPYYVAPPPPQQLKAEQRAERVIVREVERPVVVKEKQTVIVEQQRAGFLQRLFGRDGKRVERRREVIREK